jgi:Ca2+-binding RTX toxin-like protein
MTEAVRAESASAPDRGQTPASAPAAPASLPATPAAPAAASGGAGNTVELGRGAGATITVERPAEANGVNVVPVGNAARIRFNFPLSDARIIVLDVDVVLVFSDGSKIILPGLAFDLVGPNAPNLLFGQEEVTAVRFLAAVGEVTLDLGSGTATGGHATGDTLDSIESAVGSSHADTLMGDAGLDTADYTASDGAIAIDLAVGTGSGGHAAGDTLSGIERVLGSAFSDTLSGDAEANTLEGGAGDDTLAGRGGGDVLAGGVGTGDTLDYRTSAGGVTIDLGGNTASGGDADGDTISGFEAVFGSTLAGDVLTGSGLVNRLAGGGGDDTLAGLGGADVLEGGDGFDTADYTGSTGAVTVDHGAGTGLGGHAEGDTLSGIERILGSGEGDTLSGSGADETFEGGAGDDTLAGLGGADTLLGGAGADQLTGGAGADLLHGGSARTRSPASSGCSARSAPTH